MLNNISILYRSFFSSTFSSTPPGDVVISAIKSLPPPPLEVFSLEIFHHFLYSVATLYKLAKLYDCHEVNKEDQDQIHLNVPDMEDNDMLTLALSSCVTGCDCKSASQTIEQHKRATIVSTFNHQPEETVKIVPTLLKLSHATVVDQVFLPAKIGNILNVLNEKYTTEVSRSNNAPADNPPSAASHILGPPS